MDKFVVDRDIGDVLLRPFDRRCRGLSLFVGVALFAVMPFCKLVVDFALVRFGVDNEKSFCFCKILSRLELLERDETSAVNKKNKMCVI